MFTIEQIQAAHAKVKTGADFPAYIQDLKKLGVTYYETHVIDGSTVYHGKDGYQTSSGPKYEVLNIAEHANAEQFKQELKKHQQGGSDYREFIRQCAFNGVDKWVVSLDAMTCTYYNKEKNELITEQIPE